MVRPWILTCCTCRWALEDTWGQMSYWMVWTTPVEPPRPLETTKGLTSGTIKDSGHLFLPSSGRGRCLSHASTAITAPHSMVIVVVIPQRPLAAKRHVVATQTTSTALLAVSGMGGEVVEEYPRRGENRIASQLGE